MGSTPYNTLLEYEYCQDKPCLDIVTPKQQLTAVAWHTAAPRKLRVANIFNSAVYNRLLECSSIISDGPGRIFGFSYILFFLTSSVRRLSIMTHLSFVTKICLALGFKYIFPALLCTISDTTDRQILSTHPKMCYITV